MHSILARWAAHNRSRPGDMPGVLFGRAGVPPGQFSVAPGTPPAVAAAVTRKCDLVYNASVAAFPGARIEWYNRGAVGLTYTYGWVGPVGAGPAIADHEWNHFTLDERGVCCGHAPGPVACVPPPCIPRPISLTNDLRNPERRFRSLPSVLLVFVLLPCLFYVLYFILLGCRCTRHSHHQC